MRVVDAGADAGASPSRAPGTRPGARARSPTRTSSRGIVLAQVERVELAAAARRWRAARRSRRAARVALEAEHLDVVEEQARASTRARRPRTGTRGTGSRSRPGGSGVITNVGAVVGADPGELGDVQLGRHEVLDDVRRAHPVDRCGRGRRVRRRPSPRSAGRAVAERVPGLDGGRRRCSRRRCTSRSGAASSAVSSPTPQPDVEHHARARAGRAPRGSPRRGTRAASRGSRPPSGARR